MRTFKRVHYFAAVALSLVASATLMLALGASAEASTVSLLGLASSSQDVTIGNSGMNMINITFDGGTLSGHAVNDLNGVGGSYSMTFSPAGQFMTNTASPIMPMGSTYAVTQPAGESAMFSFSDTTSGGTVDSLGGALTVNTISDGSPQPRFNGVFQATTATGAFAGLLDSYLGIDFTLNKMSCNTLTGLNCTIENIGRTSMEAASATVSSGEVTSPEPGSLALIGLGLALVGIAVIKRNDLVLGA